MIYNSQFIIKPSMTFKFPQESEIPQEYQFTEPIHIRQYLIGGELHDWSGEVQEVRSPIYINNGNKLEQKLLGSYPLIGEKEALQAIRGENPLPFNPRELALLERDNKVKIGFPQERSLGTAETKLVSDEPNRLAVETSADKASVLVLSEINHPGWQATVDGQPYPIFTADYLLRGVILEKGKHQIEMVYRPVTVQIGGLISLATLALLVGLTIKTRGKK